MDRGRLASLMRKIQHSTSNELAVVVDEVLTVGDPIPDELTNALAVRVRDGAALANASVAKLVGRTQSRSLYIAARIGLLGDLWSVLDLYQAGIQDSELERLLCGWLFEYGSRCPDPVRRRYIAEALRDQGSLECLPALEGLEYDFSATVGVARLVDETEKVTGVVDHADNLNSRVAPLHREIDQTFGRILKDAISAVKTRGKECSSNASCDVILDPFIGAREHCKAAIHHSSQGDNGASLNYTRKALESLLKAVIGALALPVRSPDPVDTLILPKLMSVVNEHLDLPVEIRKSLETVRDDSTLGSHDQGKSKQGFLTSAITQAAIDRYRQLERFFEAVLANPEKCKKRSS